VARIFLCHASEDKAQVREVYHQLIALGFAPWLDEMDILPGQDWEYAIEQALETADFVLVFLSTRSVEKVGYVQREFRRAMYHAEGRPEGFIHTIPVKLDDCSVPRRFSHHQWASLYENGAFDRIVRALHYGLQQRGLTLPEPLTHDPSSAWPEKAPSPILQAYPRTTLSEAPAMQDTALQATPFFAPLTTREKEVLRLLVQGEAVREIAETLGISYITVRKHIHIIMRKFGVFSQRDVINLARQHHLV
jgi:DNA-binding CsgD family transcriptional regulator